MCAAITFVDMGHLTGHPYQNRRAARKAFFDRVKVLYDTEYEEDRITIVQTTLLMSYFYERSNQPKDVWHWSGIAIATAVSVGLNGEPHHRSTSLKQRRLWKRIWNSCIMRDRLISAGMRRTLRIREDQRHRPMLQVEDFEECNFTFEFESMIGTVFKDSSTTLILVKLCIALVELCQIIADSQNLQYSEPTRVAGGTQEATVKLLPRNPPPPPGEFDRCDRDLQAWYEALPVELRHHFVDEDDSRGTDCEVDRVVFLHRAVLTGIYLATKSTLHRPRCMPAMTSTAETRDDSERKVHDAAEKICDIYGDLFVQNLMAFVPNTGVGMLLPACVVLLKDIQSTKSHTRDASKRRFRIGANALERLREIYASSDFAVGVLWEAVRKIAPQMVSPQSTTRETDMRKAAQEGYGEATRSANEPRLAASILLFSSTLAPNEKKLLHSWACEPPSDDLRSVMMGTTSAHFLESFDDTEPYMGPADQLSATTPNLDWYEFEDWISFG